MSDSWQDMMDQVQSGTCKTRKLYNIISSESIQELENLVSSACKDGWEPTGGMSVVPTLYKSLPILNQAITKTVYGPIVKRDDGSIGELWVNRDGIRIV